MFKDYYVILDIVYPSDAQGIKSAYRKQSLKWHPDRNRGRNTEEEMKAVNEAYSILGNPMSKERYDREYQVFKQSQRGQEKRYYQNEEKSRRQNYSEYAHQTRWEYNYNVEDETLKQDIKNARKSAEEYVQEFFASLKSDSQKAARGAWEEMWPYLFGGIAMSILVFCVQTCS